ncbi:lipase family protein [Methylocaldum marinum]|nr:lipase family protein [Methylocaldum marinum]
MAGPRKAIPPSFGFRNLDALLLPARNYRYFQNWGRFPFDAAAREHSPVNAWWLADCALLVYEDPENIRSVLGSVNCFAPASFRLFENPRTGLCGFAVQGEDFAVLSLRGTEFYRPADIVRDLDKLASMGTDIRQDMKLRMGPFDGPPKFQVPVVQGFCQPLRSIWTDLENWISSLPRSSNLWLTGHSLGAAMAAMIAFQFPDQVAGLYTYGCPCPGGQEFADAFGHLGLDQRSFRYVHGNDLVAKGLEFPGTPYRHVGTLVAIDTESRKNLLERAWSGGTPGHDGPCPAVLCLADLEPDPRLRHGESGSNQSVFISRIRHHGLDGSSWRRRHA